MNTSEHTKPLTQRAFRLRVLILVALAVVGVMVMSQVAPIKQRQDYHDFADQQTRFGIEHFADVVSNVPFLVIGLHGLWFLIRNGYGPDKPVRERAEWWCYLLLFLGVGLTGFGSTYYHLHPDNDRLVWDRLPMSLAFMSLLAALLSERIGPRAGGLLLVPLVAVGAGSVVYWHVTEQQGWGDLRPYYLVQGYPMLAIVLIPLLFPARYTRTLDLYVALGWYVLAKVCEHFDRQIYDYGQVISGHTLKHLLGAMSVYWIVRMVRLRGPREAST